MMDVDSGTDLRSRALITLRKKREFWSHVAAYGLINGMLVVIWAMTGANFFWPAFPMLGWGVGIFFHAWDTFSRGPSEATIQREMERLR